VILAYGSHIPSENQLQAIGAQTSAWWNLIHDSDKVREQFTTLVRKYGGHDFGIKLGFSVMKLDKSSCQIAAGQCIKAVFYELTFR
jgi:hypothetical protein